MKEPTLTLPPAEAEMVLREYAAAKRILEFGSGGSTVAASRITGAEAISVESDKAWCDMMRDWFKEHPPIAKLDLIHADIGPTREWGYPKTDTHWRQYPDYPFAPWLKHPEFQPDVVLIDGRFRVGCFIATLLSIKKSCTILFDDYEDRPAYHVVEEFSPVVERAGRMTKFRVKPRKLSAFKMPDLLKIFMKLQ